MSYYSKHLMLIYTLNGRKTLPDVHIFRLILSPKAELGSSLEICFMRPSSPELEKVQNRLLSPASSKYKLGAHYTYLGEPVRAQASLLCPAGPAGEPQEEEGVLVGGVRAFPVQCVLILRTDGGSSCVGPVRSHRSCHTEVKLWDPLPG